MNHPSQRLYDFRNIRNAITQAMWMIEDGMFDDGVDYDEYMALLGLLKAIPDFTKQLKHLKEIGACDHERE